MKRSFTTKPQQPAIVAPQPAAQLPLPAPPPGIAAQPTAQQPRHIHPTLAHTPGLPLGLRGHQFVGSTMTTTNDKLWAPTVAKQGGLPTQSFGGTEEVRKGSALPVPGEGLKKAINYYADFGGCGLWRMTWPAMMLNGYQKAVVNDLTVMLPAPHLYDDADAVRIQRQASKDQRQFAYFLAEQQRRTPFNLIYEIDDVVFPEDIPDYNRCKDAFLDPKLADNIKYIIDLCNKFSVVSPYMKQYYQNKLSLPDDKVVVVPNYPPRFWLDNYYSHEQKMLQYEQNKQRPRIGYCGSGTHFDVANRTGYRDDFSHVSRHVLSTLKKYQWVFLGGVPPALRQYQQDGTIQVFPWTMIYDFPRTMASLNLQAVVAPLADNEFNRAKSDIKVLEAGALGVPGTFQNLPCYNNIADSVFDTGEQMLHQLSKILRDSDSYSKAVASARAKAEGMWLEDNLDKFTSLYFD